MRVSADPLVLDALRDHARRAHPEEACGLLARTVNAAAHPHFVRYIPMANIAENPTEAFAMDQVEIARMDKSLRDEGLRLGAVFHSHPSTPASPSDADRRAAWPDLAQLILGVDDRLRAFWPVEGELVSAGTIDRRTDESQVTS